MPSTATPGTHQVTLNLTTLGNVTRAYTSPSPEVAGWATADGWTIPSAGTVTPSDGLVVTSTAATNYITKTVAVAAGKVRRVRARVRLQDPEGRPALVKITDNLAATDSVARLVSGVPVWIEGSHAADSVTGVRVQVDRPAGAASVAIVVEVVTFDTQAPGAEVWYVTRQDANGLAPLVGGYPVGSDVAGTGPLLFGSRRGGATGALTFVDREVALYGAVEYRVYDETLALQAILNTGPTSTGYGVLHRVTDPASTMHQVNVIDYRGGRAAVAQPIQVLQASLPNIPLAPLAATAGTLVCYFDTLDAAQVVADDLATGEVFLLRQNVASRSAMNAYLVAQSVDIARDLEDLETPKWAMTATYLRVARPLTP